MLLSGLRIALKIVIRSRSASKQALAEAKMLATVLNPHDTTQNVVKLLNVFVYRGHLCLAFEMLTGMMTTLVCW